MGDRARVMGREVIGTWRVLHLSQSESGQETPEGHHARGRDAALES